MMVDAVTFICIVISYLLLMTPVCMILMQEMSSFYNTFMSSLFALWDATIGGPSLGGNMHLLYISVSIFHATLANVYLLNYLIAILSTVYEEMLEKGNFGPMSNKYMYIERYLIPMKDPWGFAELVVHPPPINYLTVLLIPFAFSDKSMVKGAYWFSLLIFWIENLYYIFEKLLYELILVPFVFFRTIFNVIKVANFFNGIYIITLWIFLGLFYLIYCVGQDMFYFIKLLTKLNEDDPVYLARIAEERRQDEIVIFSEVIDTMNTLFNLFKYKHKKMEIKKKKKRH